ILNDVPYSYAAHWGMPAEISRRRSALVNACGAGASAPFAMVQDMQHRDADVLMLYPLDLVAVDERFGSWMTQYGYANYVTADKLLERGRVENGAVRMAGRRFTTVVALFEPFPSDRLLALLRELAAAGGRVIWSGPPPALSLAPWQEIFGVDYIPGVDEGIMAPGKVVQFEGPLAKVAPQTILTDFLVDRIYPVRPREGTTPVARVMGDIVGARRGNAVFLGFRPRDDQSRSLGYDARTWFDILDALGAYPGADNTERLSRTGPYLTCRFPNGAVGIAPHLREYQESWPGGFARKPEEDARILLAHPPPPETIDLRDYTVNGHVVSYHGAHAVAFRPGLAAFAGRQCHEITLDGRRYRFADRDMTEISWAPVAPGRRVPGGAVLEVIAAGAGTVRIPFAQPVRLVTEAGAAVPSRRENGAVVFAVTKQISGKRLFGVP
ncbi:MAG: hypothetical protein M1436_03765, partial [Acidobacteria bacterium]|nr:hypothetical protein [Acidobacteriota bacterium]